MKANKDSITVAQFITQKITESSKTQREIANEAGFNNSNIITMFKTGDTKLPLDRVGPLAKALDVDPAYLLRLVMLEYAPDTWCEVETTLKSIVLTANEAKLVREYRRLNGAQDQAVKLVRQGSELKIIAA